MLVANFTFTVMDIKEYMDLRPYRKWARRCKLSKLIVLDLYCHLDLNTRYISILSIFMTKI